jgi:hypothetical protein
VLQNNSRAALRLERAVAISYMRSACFERPIPFTMIYFACICNFLAICPSLLRCAKSPRRLDCRRVLRSCISWCKMQSCYRGQDGASRRRDIYPCSQASSHSFTAVKMCSGETRSIRRLSISRLQFLTRIASKNHNYRIKMLTKRVHDIAHTESTENERFAIYFRQALSRNPAKSTYSPKPETRHSQRPSLSRYIS